MADYFQGSLFHFSDRAQYLAALLNSLEEQISVIDRDGVIHYTNLAWNRFAEQNGMPACRQAMTGWGSTTCGYATTRWSRWP